MIRDFILAVLAMLAVLTFGMAVSAAIWPRDRHPLVIDAGSPTCAFRLPAPRGGGSAPPPLSDTRRIA